MYSNKLLNGYLTDISENLGKYGPDDFAEVVCRINCTNEEAHAVRRFISQHKNVRGRNFPIQIDGLVGFRNGSGFEGKLTLDLLTNQGLIVRAVDVIFNDPATIVFWSDNTKTVVKCQPGDIYSPEAGLAMCYMKKALGNSSRAFNNALKPAKDWGEPDIPSEWGIGAEGMADVMYTIRNSYRDRKEK